MNGSTWSSSFSKNLKLRLSAQIELGSWKLNKTALGQTNCESIIFVFKKKKKKEEKEKMEKKQLLDSSSLKCLPDLLLYFSLTLLWIFPPSRELHDNRKASLKGQWERWVVDGWSPFLLNGNKKKKLVYKITSWNISGIKRKVGRCYGLNGVSPCPHSPAEALTPGWLLSGGD